MATGFTHRTAVRIFEAIAPEGSSVDELVQATQLARNTVLTYCREMERLGYIEIQTDRVSGGWAANIYYPLKMPVGQPDTLRARLRDAIAVLEDEKLSPAKARERALAILQGG